MIPSAFDYERAESVEHAIQLLQESGGEAKLLAGGHSLLPLMKLRLSSPAKLVDIGRIQELRGISRAGDRIVVGALTTHAAVAHDATIGETLPVLAEAASQIGDLQVRNRGTVGGNLAHADMASDLPAVALALDAQFTAQTSAGTQTISVEDFFLGPMTTAMPENGILTAVSFAVPPSGAKSVYEKYPHPASGYAVVGVAAVVGLDSEGRVNYVRIGVTGAADVPYRAYAVEEQMMGQPFTAELAASAAKHAADDGSISEDLFASEDYRRHLCSVMAERALTRLLEA